MYFVSYGTSYISDNTAFRLPWGLQMVPAAVLLACLPFMPRSPRWLASKGRWDESLHAMAALHAGGDMTDPGVLGEMKDIRDRVKFVKFSSRPIKEWLIGNLASKLSTRVAPGWNHSAPATSSASTVEYSSIYGLSSAGPTPLCTISSTSFRWQGYQGETPSLRLLLNMSSTSS